MGPEPVQIAPQHVEPSSVDGVNSARPLGTVGDEAGLLQDAEVLRDRGTADGQLPCELANGARVLDQALKDGAPRRVTKGVPGTALVSSHEPLVTSYPCFVYCRSAGPRRQRDG